MVAAYAYDRATVRVYDGDGRLHVAVAAISKATVNDYLGSEIPDYQSFGLDPRRAYPLLRPADELAKAAATFNGLPLLSRHVEVAADNHPHGLVVGACGNDASFAYPYLQNSLAVWDGDAIAAIESGARRELSAGYRYTLDPTPGTVGGRSFFARMTNIIGNHVAIVDMGRAGADVVVGDAFPRNTRFK
jgi:uncharacterized protein